jgi:hypothetical protein
MHRYKIQEPSILLVASRCRNYSERYKNGEETSMRSGFSPVAGGMGDHEELRESEAAPQLARAKAAGTFDSDGTSPLGAGTAGRSAQIVYPRQLQASE